MVSYRVALVQPSGYAHSLAFQELAELLVFSLQDLGHECAFEINRFDRARRNIVLGAQLLPSEWQAQLPRDTIIVNTEQLGSAQHAWTDPIVNLAQRLTVWDYNSHNITFLQSQGARDVRRLELGFQPRLARLNLVSEPDVDVLFYGSMGERRQRLLSAIEQQGLRVKALFGVYGRERDAWIERSKIVLNCHHYETQIFEIVRVFYLLTNGVAVVGEVGPDTHIEEPFKSAIVAAPYEEIPARCAELAADAQARAVLASRGAEQFRHRSQAELLRPLL
jgi:hypothetical protein